MRYLIEVSNSGVRISVIGLGKTENETHMGAQVVINGNSISIVEIKKNMYTYDINFIKTISVKESLILYR